MFYVLILQFRLASFSRYFSLLFIIGLGGLLLEWLSRCLSSGLPHLTSIYSQWDCRHPARWLLRFLWCHIFSLLFKWNSIWALGRNLTYTCWHLLLLKAFPHLRHILVICWCPCNKGFLLCYIITLWEFSVTLFIILTNSTWLMSQTNMSNLRSYYWSI